MATVRHLNFPPLLRAVAQIMYLFCLSTFFCKKGKIDIPSRGQSSIGLVPKMSYTVGRKSFVTTEKFDILFL